MPRVNVEVMFEKLVCSSNNRGLCDLLLRDGHQVKCPGVCSNFTEQLVAV